MTLYTAFIRTTTTATTTQSTITTASTLTTLTSLPTPVYVGCYRAPTGPILEGLYNTSLSMTHELAALACAKQGASYMALEVNSYRCGNFLKSDIVKYDDDWCNNWCYGNYGETCGGMYLYSVYTLDGSTPGVPNGKVGSNTATVAPPTSDPNYVGCFSSAPDGYPLGEYSGDTTYASVQEGYRICGNSAYIGLFDDGYGINCGNSILAGVTQYPESKCTTQCPGDPTQICGGQYAFSVWRNPAVPLS
jgi:hypothetical protein